MFAYVTLVTNDDYGLGALALARSLKMVGARWPLVVLALPNAGRLDELEAEGCIIKQVTQLPLSDDLRQRHTKKTLHSLAPFTKGMKPLFHDPLDNFVKLRLWQLTDYKRVVFLDADAIVVKNIDDLFKRNEFDAAPNLYETMEDMNRLNSGVFVARPDLATYDDMLTSLDIPGVFWRRTDQTFLESYFPDWRGLPYTDNCLQYVYFNLPELWQWDKIRVVHYQYEKPWEADHNKRHLLQPVIDLWWSVLEHRTAPRVPVAAGLD